MNRMIHLTVVLALLFSFCVCFAEDDRASVTFRHFDGTEIGPEDCRVVTSALETMTEQWYAATQDVTIDRRLRVNGTVNLVL